MFKAAAVAISASIIALLLKKNNPEFAMLSMIAAGLIVLSFFISCIESVIDNLQNIRTYYRIPVDMEPLFKSVGITCAAQVTSNFCRDCEQTAMATKIELVGNVIIILLSLPIVKDILDIVVNTI